jgi:glutaredoxin-like protein
MISSKIMTDKTETLLNEDITAQVRELFAQLEEPVHVLFFGRNDGCDSCADALQLLQEVVSLSAKLSLAAYDLDDDAEIAAQYRVDKAPGTVIAALDGEQIHDFGIRYAGIASGHEFSSLIHDLVLVSGRDSGLDASTRAFLKSLTQPVSLQVFVTPTCPYCPRAVVLAHQMALESPMVQAEMVEAMEFPDLADYFNVSGVPQTTINSGAGTLVGAVPEANLVAEIERALRN